MRCIGVFYSKPFENFIAPHTTEYRYIRRQINVKRVSKLNSTPSGLNATSFVLQPKTERKIGCDAAIILANNKAQEFKVCCFEAEMLNLVTKLNI